MLEISHDHRGADGGAAADACVAIVEAAPSSAAAAFTVVRRHEELAALAETVARAGTVALDTETTGLDPLRDQLRLVQLGLPDGRTFLIDVFETGALGPVAEALADTTVVGHHLQFDLAFLRRHAGVEPRARCTESASRLLDGGLSPHVKGHHSLRCVIERELGVALDKTEQTSDWSGPLRPEQLRYAARDVAHLLRLHEVLAAKLRADGLERVFDLERALLPGVVALELDGVGVDRVAWEALVTAGQAQAADLRARLCGELGIENPDAHQQVARALRKAGVRIDRTSKEVLAGFGHMPIVRALLRYRAQSSFVRGAGLGVLSALEAHGDGRVHARLDPLAAPTGRFGCRGPNLLALPRRAEVRRCIVPVGSVLIAADYAAIELRVLARVTGDERLRDIFNAGGDPHAPPQPPRLASPRPPSALPSARLPRPSTSGSRSAWGRSASSPTRA